MRVIIPVNNFRALPQRHGWRGVTPMIHFTACTGARAGVPLLGIMGSRVRNWKNDDQVTVPFCIGGSLRSMRQRPTTNL